VSVATFATSRASVRHAGAGCSAPARAASARGWLAAARRAASGVDDRSPVCAAALVGIL